MEQPPGCLSSGSTHVALGQADMAGGTRMERTHHLLKGCKGNHPFQEGQGMTHIAAPGQPKSRHYPGR